MLGVRDALGLYNRTEAVCDSKVWFYSTVLGRFVTADPLTADGSKRYTCVGNNPISPSAWHREIGQALADVYGVHRFDPETFVCIGSGAPIGYPVMEIEASPAEWDAFRHVDRNRGDALLGMCWQGGAAPEGW